MAVCLACGSNEPEGFRFCSSCGRPIAAQPSTAPSAGPAAAIPRPAPPATSSTQPISPVSVAAPPGPSSPAEPQTAPSLAGATLADGAAAVLPEKTSAPAGRTISLPPVTFGGVLTGFRFLFDVMFAPGPAFAKIRESSLSWFTLVLPFITFAALFSQGLSEILSNRLLGYGLGLFIGGFFGVVVVGLIALLAHGVSFAFGSRGSVRESVTFVSGGFGAAVLYSLLGLATGILFGWYTSSTFGMVGILWALVPIMSGFRLTRMNSFGAIVTGIITILLVIFAWVSVTSLVVQFS